MPEQVWISKKRALALLRISERRLRELREKGVIHARKNHRGWWEYRSADVLDRLNRSKGPRLF